ncbi:trypsin-like peptidase domain-containing protein [Curvivirga aplysinae]|uniref:trypsin-like peptidase domain-containing protein n=1 Tax=Curvivirga aplysinae TaxID=2529852 RepID=UPI0012BC5D4B|nr:trypsin-like peptidase domain-containing protein [Curvivirga aplysinae]MTI11465.1 hypothetical protein [Curvivirga aplysinae]
MIHPNLNYTAVWVKTTFYNGVSGQSKTGVGTGFFVYGSSDEVFFITNRHIVDLEYGHSKYKHQGYELGRIQVKFWQNDAHGKPVKLVSALMPQYLVFHNVNEDEDVAVIRTGGQLACDVGGPIKLDFIVPYDWIATETIYSDGAFICSDRLVFSGFPEWYGEDYRPLMREGVISSDPRFDYKLPEKGVNGTCVAYEAFSFSGSSGSPVFAIQRGVRGEGIVDSSYREMYLVGINAGHLIESKSGAHSGMSYFFKSYVLKKMLDSIK